MSSRDKYKSNIKCPSCGQKGILHISEDDNPYLRKYNRAVNGVEGNFQASMQGDTDIKIICKDCGTSFMY
jgi:hypothetical protein